MGSRPTTPEVTEMAGRDERKPNSRTAIPAAHLGYPVILTKNGRPLQTPELIAALESGRRPAKAGALGSMGKAGASRDAGSGQRYLQAPTASRACKKACPSNGCGQAQPFPESQTGNPMMTAARPTAWPLSTPIASLGSRNVKKKRRRKPRGNTYPRDLARQWCSKCRCFGGPNHELVRHGER